MTVDGGQRPGYCSPGDAATLGAAIGGLADERTLVVVSSDFVHYGWRFDYVPFPSTGADAERYARRLIVAATRVGAK